MEHHQTCTGEHHVRHRRERPDRPLHRHRRGRRGTKGPHGDHRCALPLRPGQDLKDKELLASAFAADAELDFRPAVAKWGAPLPLMTGRDTIVTTILGMFTGRVDTTHQVTNLRITIDGDTARLTALVEAQHLLTADPTQYALLKNPYDVELVRDRDRWVIRRLVIDNTWFVGEPTAIFG
ncbi:nuclear transport factor 2 family protein [Streptomyces griseofuscus]|uniref:nuclear transport factor 2 family protein n=1 Tax=Streptomyces griseofuscus TaxID=146922 RepID=UPI003711F1E6